MVHVQMDEWGQTLEDVRRASVDEPHRRSRERFHALYLIASGQLNARACAAHIGRRDETVLGWVHRYNERGPDAPAYHRTGGRAPLLTGRSRNGSPTSSRRVSLRGTTCPATAGR